VLGAQAEKMRNPDPSRNIRLTIRAEDANELADAVMNSDANDALKAHVWAWLHGDERWHRPARRKRNA